MNKYNVYFNTKVVTLQDKKLLQDNVHNNSNSEDEPSIIFDSNADPEYVHHQTIIIYQINKMK